MARSRNHNNMPSWLMTFITFATLILPAQSLYFYMDASTPKCFFEELPKDTLVVGAFLFSLDTIRNQPSSTCSNAS